jgi:outer membrane receptor protein involved in Fe transport
VGNVVTSPNARLDPERLTGVEAGLLLSTPSASVRLTGFRNELEDAIANVTLGTTPALIVRQRQNAGRVRATGVEVEADWRPHPVLLLTAAATYTDARFRGTAALPALAGKRVPQVPRTLLNMAATVTAPRGLTLTAQARVSGGQFDDDLNELALDPYVVVDLAASRPLGRRLGLFAGVENLLDAEYDVGRTPVRTVGWPRTLRASLRFFWP